MQIENMTFEFRDPKIERLVSLTPADRKWMDDVVRTVEETFVLVGFALSFVRVALIDCIAGTRATAVSHLKLYIWLPTGQASEVAMTTSGPASKITSVRHSHRSSMPISSRRDEHRMFSSIMSVGLSCYGRRNITDR